MNVTFVSVSTAGDRTTAAVHERFLRRWLDVLRSPPVPAPSFAVADVLARLTAEGVLSAAAAAELQARLTALGVTALQPQDIHLEFLIPDVQEPIP